MMSKRSSPVVALNTRPSFGFLICLPLLLSLVSPIVVTANAQDEPSGMAPADIWSEDYTNMIFPWAPANDLDRQFKEYHTYETTKDLMLQLEQENPEIFEFHEGLLGGYQRSWRRSYF